jgi:L-arabinokinase
MYRVRTAVDHLIAENEHAEQFLQAIEELSERSVDGRPAMRDAEERQRTQQRAGRLALASHHSYRLRLELSCAQADWIVDRLMQAGPERGIYGGRITGVGGGGTVMALVERSPAAGEAVLEIMEGYLQMTGLPLAVIEAGGAGSAGAMFSNASG